MVLDSSRIKGVKDSDIQRLLINKTKDLPTLKNLIFINKHGQIVDIMALV